VTDQPARNPRPELLFRIAQGLTALATLAVAAIAVALGLPLQRIASGPETHLEAGILGSGSLLGSALVVGLVALAVLVYAITGRQRFLPLTLPHLQRGGFWAIFIPLVLLIWLAIAAKVIVDYFQISPAIVAVVVGALLGALVGAMIAAKCDVCKLWSGVAALCGLSADSLLAAYSGGTMPTTVLGSLSKFIVVTIAAAADAAAQTHLPPPSEAIMAMFLWSFVVVALAAILFGIYQKS